MPKLIAASAALGLLCSILTNNTYAADWKAYVARTAKAAQSLPSDRRKLLDPIAASIAGQLKKHRKTAVVFVCTHNSRRSQFAQAWAQAATSYYELADVQMASGGTEATAANIRTIQSLRRAGFDVKVAAARANPVYELSHPPATKPIRLFSKVYYDKRNPQQRFVAVMCCGDADEKCPVVKGAAARFPLHYVDPKVSDGTPREAATYDERSRQIAAEMFYLVLQVKRLARANNIR